MQLNTVNILKKIDIFNMKYPNTNLTYRQVLQQEIKRFKKILQRKIDDYYDSYSPSIYKRGSYGGNLHNALSIDDICTISSNGKQLVVNLIINDSAIHNSILNGANANAFWLVNDGWRVKEDIWFNNIYRFGYFEGAHYVEDAVDEFEKSSSYRIKVKVIRPLLYY